MSVGPLTPVAVLAAALLAPARPAAGQTERPTRESTLFLEAAGSSLIYSVNIDRVLVGGSGDVSILGRAGVMLVPWMRGSWAVPLGVALRIGGGRHALEFGGLRVFGDLHDHDYPPGWSLVAAWRGTFGRLVLRAGVTSLVSDPVDLGDRDTRWLWPIASVGWSFGGP